MTLTVELKLWISLVSSKFVNIDTSVKYGKHILSLYKVMNRAGANRESLLPYAQAPMKKKSTENATLMSARHYESENARRDASAQASPRLPHARG